MAGTGGDVLTEDGQTIEPACNLAGAENSSRVALHRRMV